jgi:multidrug efflux pump subunit AcrA (membrane-fusion protein)
VAPETNGVIKTTPVDVGSYVTQGQVIARLDDRDPKLRLQQAQAARAQAEAALRQAESKIGLAQNQTFDAANVPEVLAAKAAYESAQAQAKLARSATRIWSPQGTFPAAPTTKLKRRRIRPSPRRTRPGSNMKRP